MFSLYSKFSDNLTLLVLASFAFMSVFGMSMGMEIKDGQMSSCPFMAGQAAMCQMNITEHIAQWQRAFIGIPTRADLLALATVLLGVVIITFVKPLSKLEESVKFTAQLSAYRTRHIAKVFDPFFLAFSDGILNPKIYEPAHI